MIVIQHQDTVCSGHYEQWLPPHRVLRPDRGDAIPTRADEPLVVLGGEMNARSDHTHPWLPAVRHLLADHIARSIPALGICLGAQLLSVAAGGGVAIGDPAGTELGTTRVTLRSAAASDPLFTDFPPTFNVVCAHSDGIRPLPPDAVLLAESDRYPQAFRIGDCVWGVQYHPEVTWERFQQWAAEDICSMPDHSPKALQQLLDDTQAHWQVMGILAHQLATNFARVLA